MNATDIAFLSELGHRLTSVTRNPRETMYRFQRVSLAVSDTIRWLSRALFWPSPNWTSAIQANPVFNS